MDEEKELRAAREHRELKEFKREVNFLELQLSAEVERRCVIEQLLHEMLRMKYYDEYKCSATCLRDVQAAFPKIAGERR